MQTSKTKQLNSFEQVFAFKDPKQLIVTMCAPQKVGIYFSNKAKASGTITQVKYTYRSMQNIENTQTNSIERPIELNN